MGNTVKERSPLFMTLVFKDENGAPLVPTTVEWRLDDRESDTEIIPWTILASPAATMAVTIPGINNTIVTETNIRERRTFGIRLNDGLPAEAHDQLHYHVLNLFGPKEP